MITTCILSYNHPQLTEQAVNHALVHVSPQNLVLLHNGSELTNVQYLKEKFPQIQHHELQVNKGYSGGANALLGEVFKKTEWVLFLTNDCHLLSPPQVPDQKGFYSPLIWSRKVGRVDSFIGVVNFKNGQLSHVKENSGEFSDFCMKYIPGSAFILHKQIFLEVGGFDESLGTYWEDVDFSIRVQKKGFQVDHFSPIEILHKVGKTCHKHSHYTTYLYQRNRRIVCRRHCPPDYQTWLEWGLFWDSIRTSWTQIKKRKWKNLRLFQKALKDARALL